MTPSLFLRFLTNKKFFLNPLLLRRSSQIRLRPFWIFFRILNTPWISYKTFRAKKGQDEKNIGTKSFYNLYKTFIKFFKNNKWFLIGNATIFWWRFNRPRILAQDEVIGRWFSLKIKRLSWTFDLERWSIWTIQIWCNFLM